MLNISSKVKLSRLVMALVAGLFYASLTTPETFAQNSGAAFNAYPALSGTYTSSAQHPRVFTTPAEIKDLVARINSSGSFSAQNFSKLANQVKAELAANVDWDAAYSGCDLDIYLHSFSYEPPGGYAGEIRNAAELSAAMHVKPGLAPPRMEQPLSLRDWRCMRFLSRPGLTTLQAPRPRVRRQH